ncbi:MAG: DNA polymerase I [Microbacteriaceae bacterium]
MVIDGHSLAFRAFYALPPDSFRTADGQYTNAIHGFISMLLSTIQQEKPTHLVVAFDPHGPTFRSEEYPEYKGTRGETPEEFIGQVELLAETLEDIGIRTITIPNFEADDVLATLAQQGSDADYHVLLISGDRDTIQLINEHTTLLYPVKGVSTMNRYDIPAIVERYGIRPEQYPDIAALVGETSDNLPGVPGVGPKTAAKWVSEWGNLDGVLEHAADIKGKVGESFREHKDLAIRNRKLNALIRTLELPYELDELMRQEANPAAIERSFDRLEFRTLKERAKKILAPDAPEQWSADETAPISASEQPEILSDKQFLEWLQAEDTTALWLSAQGSTITAGLSRLDGHYQAELLQDNEISRAITQWLESSKHKVVYDAKGVQKLLFAQGLVVNGLIFDTNLAGWLQQPTKPQKSLEEQVTVFLGEELPVPPADQLLPEVEEVSNGIKAWYLYRIYEQLAAQIDEDSARILLELDLPLTSVLAKLENNGISVDVPALNTLDSELAQRLAKIEAEAYASIGREVNLSSPKQLQEVLYQQLGLKPTKATKTGFSTNAEALADLSLVSDHPFLELLLSHRDSNKLKQITQTLMKSVGPDHRIHTSFQQTGTATGRISSQDPNLQNIPVRTEEGRRLRAAFIHSAEYETLLTADYSQIEMRIMAHLSGDEGLIQAFQEGEDLHNFVGSQIFGVPGEQVTPAMRTKVKAMSYGLVYGLSAFGLSRQLRIDVSEAKQLMTGYFDRFGKVRDYLRSIVEEARQLGYTQTILGRRRYFPELVSTNRLVREGAERAALNAPIQGSAADIIKSAMIDIQNECESKDLQSRMLLQVHDELIFDVAPGELVIMRELVERNMRAATQLTVPLEVHIGVGPNWDAAAH